MVRRSSRRLSLQAPVTDAALVVRALSGDHQAFEELVQRYQGVVRVVVLRCGRKPEHVDDLVQDTFLKAFSHLRRLERPSLFRSWLLQIAANRARDNLRRDQRRKQFQRDRIEELSATTRLLTPASSNVPEGDAPAHFERNEVLGYIEDEIQALPERYQGVATLRYLHRWTYPDIAETVGISETVVKQRLWRARTLLRARLHRWRPAAGR